MSWLYLLALLVSLTGMVVLDLRFGLFFARSWWRAAIVMAVGIAFFLVWDVAGIAAGVFFRGNPDLLTGVLLGPELPLEELFFLALLCYTVMNSYAFAVRRSSDGAPPSPPQPSGDDLPSPPAGRVAAGLPSRQSSGGLLSRWSGGGGPLSRRSSSRRRRRVETRDTP